MPRCGSLSLDDEVEQMAHGRALALEVEVEGPGVGALGQDRVQLGIGRRPLHPRLLDQELKAGCSELIPLGVCSPVMRRNVLGHAREPTATP